MQRLTLLVLAALAGACGQVGVLDSPGALISPSPTAGGLAETSPAASPTASALPFDCPSDFDGELAAITALQKIQLHVGTSLAPIGIQSYSATFTRTHDADQAPSFLAWNTDAPAATVSLGGTLTLSLSGDGARVDAVVARYFRRDRLPDPLVGSDPTPVATRPGTVNADGTATIKVPTTAAAYVAEFTVNLETTCFTASGLEYVSVNVR